MKLNNGEINILIEFYTNEIEWCMTQLDKCDRNEEPYRSCTQEERKACTRNLRTAMDLMSDRIYELEKSLSN